MMDNDPAGGGGFENGIVYAPAEEMGFEHEPDLTEEYLNPDGDIPEISD